MISASTNSSKRGRLSISMTGTPIVAKIDAYSVPITPPPTMTMDVGKAFEREEAVGIDDGVIVEGNVGRSGRLGPDGDDDQVGSMFSRFRAAC